MGPVLSGVFFVVLLSLSQSVGTSLSVCVMLCWWEQYEGFSLLWVKT